MRHYRLGAHTKSDLKVHLVWANHYFTGATSEQLKQVLDSFFRFWDETLAKPSARAASRQ